MAASMKKRVEIINDGTKGRCLHAIEEIGEGDTIFDETPLVCAQFSWNAFFKYDACEYCMRSIETAETNARRLSKQEQLVLPHPECCETILQKIVVCEKCSAKYCSIECKNQAFTKYHSSMCTLSHGEGSPLKHLDEAWRNIHYPPETSSITLITKLISMVKQTSDKQGLLDRVSVFCNRTVNEEEQLLHKLLGQEFSGQLEMLREMVAGSLYEEAVQKWFTPEGFQSLLAMIGTNGQGIGTSALSVWVKNCDALDLKDGERKELDDVIDTVYSTIEHADKMVNEDGMEEECGGDAFLNCEGSGLYETQSAANHSCDPNAEVTFPSNNSTLRFVATKPIEPGEEVFISYLDECMRERSRHSRQKYLRENYLFLCDCIKCQSQADQADETSDEEEDSEKEDMSE